MTAKQIAQMIPAEYRKEILETKMVESAIPSDADPSMAYLAAIWKGYIAPAEDITCPLCLQRILKNYRELYPLLVDIEKSERLLHSA